jgi:hypothetical protein
LSVLGNIADFSLEDLTNLENASSLSIFLPEVRLDMGNGINTNSVKIKLLDSILDPLEKGLSHELVVLVQVRQVSKAAIFDLVLIIPVVDLTFGVVVLFLVEGVHQRVGGVNPCYMVSHNI